MTPSRFLICGFAFNVLFALSANASTFNLNFSDGLLPSEHGFTFIPQGLGVAESQILTVANGLLTWDAPASGGGAYEMQMTMPDAFVMEWRARVLVFGNTWANSFSVSRILGEQEWEFGLTATGVSQFPVGEIASVDTSTFQTYKLVVAADDSYRFFINNGFAASGSEWESGDGPQGVFFGQGTATPSSVELDFIRFFAVIPGDFDFDANVVGDDLLAWQRMGGDLQELNQWQASYGADANPFAATSVPEASAIILAAAASLSLAAAGRRRT